MAQNVEVKNFSFYSQKDGLSNYNIHKIVQDNKKFLWIATQDGLNRFDGTHFIVYNKGLDDRHALLSNDIRDLIYDSVQQIIWVINNVGGINGVDVINGDVVATALYSNRMLEAGWRTSACFLKNNIYIGTTSGMEVFNTRTRQFIPLNAATLSFPYGFYNCDVRTLSVDEHQNLWIGLKDKGILIYHTSADTVIRAIPAGELLAHQSTKTFWPLTAAIVRHGIYWMGTQYGLYQIGFSHNYTTTLLPVNNTVLKPFSTTQINYIRLTSENSVIISGNRLNVYHPLTNELHEIKPADTEMEKWLTNIVYCMEDKQHNLWLGCKQGLGELKGTAITFLPVKNGNQLNNKLSHVFNLVAIDTAQTLASTSEGVYLIKNRNTIIPVYEGGMVQNMVRLNASDILFSTSSGLLLYNNQTVMPVGKKYSEFNRYSFMQLNSKVIVNDSITILGTESYEGILVWNTKQHTLINIRQSGNNPRKTLYSNTVNTLFFTRDKQVVVLSDYGITLLNPASGNTQKLQFTRKSTGKTVNVLMDMAETKDNYWINAYGEGLLMLDKSFRLLKTFGLKDGLSNTGLYKIFNYKDSNLVLTSNSGITFFNVFSHKGKTYYDEDGLQNNTFEEACGDTLNNTIYAGGVEGYVCIQPAQFQPSSTAPELYITGLQLLKEDHNDLDTFRLDMNNYAVPSNTLQANVYFSGIYYTNPKRVHYAYRIKEYKSDWLNLYTQASVSLIGLHNGTYTLQVKACNEDGLCSQVKELKLVFLPRWFETLGFQVSVGISIALLLYSFYYYRLSQLKKQHTIRRNLASDLHDDIGSSLNTIKVFTHLAKREENKQTYLDQIDMSLSEATTGLRDLIWVLDDSGDTIDSVIDRIKKFALPVASANGIKFECRTHVNGTEYPLSKTEKRNLLLMIKETINNSIKYANCKHILLDIVQDAKQRQIEISDDGTGFDTTKYSEGNGLKNLMHRAVQIRHTVSVISSPGHGTTVRIIKD